jgi:hypothetical protein
MSLAFAGKRRNPCLSRCDRVLSWFIEPLNLATPRRSSDSLIDQNALYKPLREPHGERGNESDNCVCIEAGRAGDVL